MSHARRRTRQLGHGCAVVAAFGVFFLAFFAPVLLRGDFLGGGTPEGSGPVLEATAVVEVVSGSELV